MRCAALRRERLVGSPPPTPLIPLLLPLDTPLPLHTPLVKDHFIIVTCLRWNTYCVMCKILLQNPGLLFSSYQDWQSFMSYYSIDAWCLSMLAFYWMLARISFLMTFWQAPLTSLPAVGWAWVSVPRLVSASFWVSQSNAALQCDWTQHPTGVSLLFPLSLRPLVLILSSSRLQTTAGTSLRVSWQLLPSAFHRPLPPQCSGADGMRL